MDWPFLWQGGAETLKLYGLADTDHAADDESRRSVSWSQEFLGCHWLDQEVGRQTCVAISSGESEFHASRLIFTNNLVGGFGFPPVEGPIAYSDSSTARGIEHRKGTGKLKHLHGQSGWTGESRQGRHVAEYYRLGNEVFGRGTTEAVDWNATSARTCRILFVLFTSVFVLFLLVLSLVFLWCFSCFLFCFFSCVSSFSSFLLFVFLCFFVFLNFSLFTFDFSLVSKCVFPCVLFFFTFLFSWLFSLCVDIKGLVMFT